MTRRRRRRRSPISSRRASPRSTSRSSPGRRGRARRGVRPVSDAPTLTAGAASIAVTPPLGVDLMGYLRRSEPARGYGEPMEATALVLDDGSTRLVLVGADLIGATRRLGPGGARPHRRDGRRARAPRPHQLAAHARRAADDGLGEDRRRRRTGTRRRSATPRRSATCSSRSPPRRPVGCARRGSGSGARRPKVSRSTGASATRAARSSAGTPTSAATATSRCSGSTTRTAMRSAPSSRSPRTPWSWGRTCRRRRRTSSARCASACARGRAATASSSRGAPATSSRSSPSTPPPGPSGSSASGWRSQPCRREPPRPLAPTRPEQMPFASAIPMAIWRHVPTGEQDVTLAAAERRVELPLLDPPTLGGDTGPARRARAARRRPPGGGRAAHDLEPRRPPRPLGEGRRSAGRRRDGRALGRGAGAGPADRRAPASPPGRPSRSASSGSRSRSARRHRSRSRSATRTTSSGTRPTRPEYPLGGYEPVVAQRHFGRPAPFAPEAGELLVRHSLELTEELFADGG